jgi:multicomponent Na+:H+ antiporter subunit D
MFIPILFVFLPIFAAILLYLFKNEKFSNIVFVTQGILILLFIYYAYHLKANPNHALVVFGGFDETFAISFYNDRLSLSFLGLGIFIWMMILLYTFNTNKKENKFLFFLMFLQGVFFGLVQTNDLFNMFVFLELGTVLVTILIAYKKTGLSFKAGLYYLLLNTVGAMFFLIGIILIYYVFGTINIRIIMTNMHLYANYNIIKLAYVFMIAGISVKAALFPLFTWLPRAHGVAQSTISALLSGLIIKGALYMFIRINIYMFSSAQYMMHDFFFYLGAITALTGVIFALAQNNLKLILAYSTVSQIGLIFMGLSQTVYLSYFGGFMHIFSHAIFKALLFLCVGIIIKHYQTKKVTEIRGLMRTMPLIGIVTLVGVLSVTGLPLFNGYVSKSFIKYGFSNDHFKMALYYLINLGTITYFIKFSQIFIGVKQDIQKTRNLKQNSSVIILALSSLFVGIFYKQIATYLYSIDLSYLSLFDLMAYLEYIVFVIVGFVIYKYLILNDGLLIKKIRQFKLTFEHANYLFIVYLIVVAIFTFYERSSTFISLVVSLLL